MAGLDCAELSAAAWPYLRDGVHGTVTVADHEAQDAMRELAAAGFAIGDCGAAPLAALRALARAPEAAALREAVGFSPATRVLLIATEGPTDPVGVPADRRLTAPPVALPTVRKPSSVEVMLLTAIGLWALNLSVTRYILTHGFQPLAYGIVRYGFAALALRAHLPRCRAVIAARSPRSPPRSRRGLRALRQPARVRLRAEDDLGLGVALILAATPIFAALIGLALRTETLQPRVLGRRSPVLRGRGDRRRRHGWRGRGRPRRDLARHPHGGDLGDLLDPHHAAHAAVLGNAHQCDGDRRNLDSPDADGVVTVRGAALGSRLDGVAAA